MPKIIISKNIVKTGITSRYYQYPIAYWGNHRIPALPTYTKKDYPQNEKDRFWLVSKTREYRPDLVAFEEYGYASLWWRILEANNMKSIFDFKAGLNIRLPATII